MNTTLRSTTDSQPARRLISEHPLALIPFFRRWKEGLIRDLVYTFISGMGFCLFFFALFGYDLPADELAKRWWHVFIIGMAISYSIHGLYGLSDRLLSRWLLNANAWFRSAYHVALPMTGVCAGYFIGMFLLHPEAIHTNFVTPSFILSLAAMSIFVACVVFFLFRALERELLDKEKLASEQRRVLESERRAIEAQLRMLQAQIEPHFLYNTLANAVGLIQPSPDKARLLLERLIDYLRATLTASRDSEANLQGEIDTISAYLELMKLRMGERLRYRLLVANEARGLSLPPMLLQPLVENSITHGIEPKTEGGEIVLEANVDATHLHIVISDTGLGFSTLASTKVGGGVGLANLRERIKALYGSDGNIHIAENTAGGVSVTLRIPLLVTASDRVEL